MSESLLDGTGLGYEAKIDESNRLHTFSIVETRIADISKNNGKAFLLASDFISLTTTGSFNGLLYIKNTSDLNLFIKTVRACSDATTTVRLKYTRNPTTGTLISDQNDAYQLSSNAGSNTTFGGLAYSASGDGKTVTDGDFWTQYINRSPGHSIQDYNGAIVLSKGSSMAISAQPAASTTICIEIQCWFEV